MNRFVSFLLAAGLLMLVSSAAPLAKKFKYKSEEGKMSVAFPAEFEESEEAINDGAKTVKVSAILGDQNFFASYTVHDMPLDDPADLAQVSLDAFSEQLSGNILNTSPWTVKGQQGLKAMIKLEAQSALVDYRVLIHDHLQYQILVVGLESSWDQAAADAFFKSFKVK